MKRCAVITGVTSDMKLVNMARKQVNSIPKERRISVELGIKEWIKIVIQPN